MSIYEKYSNKQVYIGRNVDYVDYECSKDGFTIIPLEKPEDAKVFLQKAGNKAITLPEWVVKVYGLKDVDVKGEKDKHGIHCKYKQKMEFQIPKHSMVDQKPRGNLISIGVYESSAGVLSLPYQFFEEVMVTVHVINDYLELSPIGCAERKNLPYLGTESDYNTLIDYYGKSLQNANGHSIFYRTISKKFHIPAQFGKRKLEVFLSDTPDRKVYVIPLDSTVYPQKEPQVDDLIMDSLKQITQSSQRITEKYEETKKLRDEINEKLNKIEKMRQKMLSIMDE